MLITNLGQMIRIAADSLRKCSRSAGGVIIMRLAEGQNIVNFTRISNDQPDADSDMSEPAPVESGEKVDKPNMPQISDVADIEE